MSSEVTISADVRTLPEYVSYFRLNPDGSYESAEPLFVDVYIDESQVYKICQPEVSKFICEMYGTVVGVMHNKRAIVKPPMHNTTKYILGG